MKRKICLITGARSEFGLLHTLINELQTRTEFDLDLIVTGMHLSQEFGLTVQEIEKACLPIHRKVEILLSSDSPTATCKSMGLALISLPEAISSSNCDLLILLGDRFETFCAAIVAYNLKIPIAHLHGGETSEGATDEAFRHCVTKMSYWHFTSSDQHRQRVISLGESPDRVFNTGALGVDNVLNMTKFSKAEIESKLELTLNDNMLLVTFHPSTLDNIPAKMQIDELFCALDEFQKHDIIFTMPNADAEGRTLKESILNYARKRPSRVRAYESLGTQLYLSLAAHASAVIGNSSSALIEIPYLKVPSIDIGSRQRGRQRPQTVLHCTPSRTDIASTIRKALSPDFRQKVLSAHLPFGDGKAAKKIVEILVTLPNKQNIQKSYYVRQSE